MPNYSREQLKKDKNAGISVGEGLLLVTLGGLSMFAKSTMTSNKKAELQNKKAELQNKIAALDSEIASLSSGLFGSWVHSDEINQKKKEKAELQQQLDNL